MQETVYLRMRQRIKVSPDDQLLLGDLLHVKTTDDQLKKQIEQTSIYKVQPHDQNFIIIDVMHVIEVIQSIMKSVDIQTIGPNQTLIEVVYPKKKMAGASFLVIWILLFIGSGLAIMNFHEDVSMGEVHRTIYYMVTGVEEAKPLLLQIPYSFGLGIGMILFFNHLFKKRLNEEPSPLEVEMFKYQQDLDQYMLIKENQRKNGKSDDH
jgi:stage V sporulation protein AA